MALRGSRGGLCVLALALSCGCGLIVNLERVMEDAEPTADSAADVEQEADVEREADVDEAPADREDDEDADACLPDCEGRECGDDGCGGACGPVCGAGQTCDERGRCLDGDWIRVEAGTYVRGSPEGEAGRLGDEPQHEVTLTHDFWLLSREVTQAQYEAVRGLNPSTLYACGPDCPLTDVNWHASASYCNALSEAQGLAACYSCTGEPSALVCTPSPEQPNPYECPGFRLPTEAEWEYAARAGTTTATYNGDLDPLALSCETPNATLDPIAWFCGNSLGSLAPAAGKAPNPWGFYDILGSIWEWTHDGYGPYPSSAATDPFNPHDGVYGVHRGGSWNFLAYDARAARRRQGYLTEQCVGLSLRPARTILER